MPTLRLGPHLQKLLFFVWFNTKSVEIYKRQEHRTTFASVYCHQTGQVNEALREKCPAFVNGKDVIRQHDDTRADNPEKKEITKIGGSFTSSILVAFSNDRFLSFLGFFFFDQ